MRWNSFIPVAGTSNWEVRLATLGNYDFVQQASGNAKPRIYTRERVLLEVELYDITGQKTVYLSFADPDIFPTQTYYTANKNYQRDETITIDVTQFVRAGCGVMTVDYDNLSADTPDYLTIDGVHPHSLVFAAGESMQVCARFDAGPFAGSWQKIYGGLPSVAYAGDTIEVLAPLEIKEHSRNTYNNAVQINDTTIWALSKGTTPKYSGGAAGSVQITAAGHYTLDELDLEYDAQGHTAVIDDRFGTKTTINVIAKPDCQQMVWVEWNSRCGFNLKSWWHMVETTDNVKDSIELQRIDGEYDVRKGANTHIKISKSGLTAFDVWYYGSLVLSNRIGVGFGTEISECKCVTNNITAQLADVSGTGVEYYTLTVELELYNYGAD